MNLNFTLIVQIISFLVFLWLLKKFCYKPFMDYLDKRASEVRKMIEETQRNRDASNQELQKAQDTLRNTKEELLAMKEATKKDADQERISAIEQARKEAQGLLETAKLEIKKETASAKESIKADISSLAIEIARKILEREVSDKDHAKLISESLEELENGR